MAHDAEEYRKRAAKSRKQKQSGGRFKFGQGENVIRILKTPGDKERGSPSVFIEYLIHPEVGPNKRFVKCGKKLNNKGECWLCDKLIPKLQKKGRTKTAAALAPKPIFEVQIAVVEDGEMRGPERLYIGSGGAKSLSYKLQGIIMSDKRDYLDHKKGYNLVVQRTGTGKTGTSYELLGPEEESSRVPKSIVESLRPFVDVIPAYDEDRQKAAYYGREDEEEEDNVGKKKKKKKHYNDDEDIDRDDDSEEEEDDADDDDDDDEDDDEPKKKGKKKSKKKKSKDEDDEDESDDDDDDDDDADDEDDDEEEEEEEEEEVKPKKKKKKSKSKDDDDDDEDETDEDEDDDDDDEDEDDDDDTPKKSSKKKKKKKK